MLETGATSPGHVRLQPSLQLLDEDLSVKVMPFIAGFKVGA